MTANDIILSALRTGRDNYITTDYLKQITGLPERDVRRVIEDLRRHGAVILSDNNGYYLPENAAELESFVRKETKRAKSVFYTLKSARRLLREWGGDTP